jgi:signal transduction histidine kinase
MMRKYSAAGWFRPVIITGCLCAALLAAVKFAYEEWLQLEPRFHDNFDQQSGASIQKDGWKAFGGTWQVINGSMQNISDDRGAKLVNGNGHWRDYSVEADIQLLSETGDAGFVVRTNDEEVGVDAYRGYFAGLRDLDDTLILGRADFGWHELASVPVQSHVHTRTWYHLKVVAFECTIAATATTPEGEQAVVAVHDKDCVREGRFGLQSYSTGAIWRDLDLHRSTNDDLLATLGSRKPLEPGPSEMDATNNPIHPAISDLRRYERVFGPMRRELRDNHGDINATPISNLRLLAPNVSPRVVVHGVVTMVSPILFIQDSSGGVAIANARLVIPVQIGDSVEASGLAEMHNFSSVLRDASVRLLWSHTQVPPVAVTASQAATGVFEAQFIETEGRLKSIVYDDQKSITFHFEAGNQSFLAVEARQNDRGSIHSFKEGSLLRVRGLCVTDKRFTGDTVPFALLMRSGGDIQVLEPPPWWNTQHVLELVLVLIAVSIGFHVVFTSVKRSQMHAVMAERERLAMELHDTLSQSFAGLGYQLEALCRDTEPGTLMQSQLESTLDLVRFGHMQARRNIAATRPGNLEQLGLAKALEQTAQATARGGKVGVDIAVRGEPRTLPLRVSDALFRIGQEAIANAIRHGDPDQIRIRVIYGKRSVKLTVRDNGRGFSVKNSPAGFGIRGMKQRAEGIAGSFRIRSSPGHGTVVSILCHSPQPVLSSWWERFDHRQLRKGAYESGD